MVRQIAPVFFTMDIPATLAYYKEKLGFECLGTWQDPPVYAIVARDQCAIHFRCAGPPTANPDKYDEHFQAYPVCSPLYKVLTKKGCKIKKQFWSAIKYVRHPIAIPETYGDVNYRGKPEDWQ